MHQMHPGGPKAVYQDMSISNSSPLTFCAATHSPGRFSLSAFSSLTGCFLRLLGFELCYCHSSPVHGLELCNAGVRGSRPITGCTWRCRGWSARLSMLRSVSQPEDHRASLLGTLVIKCHSKFKVVSVSILTDSPIPYKTCPSVSGW